VNGESIYGTTYGPVQGVASIRTTAKDKNVFVHVFDWPSSALDIDGLQAKVISARLLATGQPLKFRQTEGKLQLDLPAQAPDPNVSTITVNAL
jgi:alpha-L-fucosidase